MRIANDKVPSESISRCESYALNAMNKIYEQPTTAACCGLGSLAAEPQRRGIKMRIMVFILILIFPSCAFGIEKADSVLVVKSEARLYLIKNNKVLNEYKVVFGANPKGHKQKEGDERTPEGSYILDYKKADSAFYKAIHISYPNKNDKKRAREAGVNPGGAIMIHGQKNGLGWFSWLAQYFNWTDGCIAVSNSAMDEIWDSISVGTPIEIKP